MDLNNDKFEIEIDESKLIPAPTIFQRLKNAAFAVILGGVLVQMYFFFFSAKISGTFTPTSIVIFYHNIYFIGYLSICAVLGWFKGQIFLDWMLVKIDFWKF